MPKWVYSLIISCLMTCLFGVHAKKIARWFPNGRFHSELKQPY